MNREVKRFEVELEEDSRRAAVMVKYTRVVRHAVLVGVQRLGTGWDVGGRHDVDEILVRDECYGTADVRIRVEHVR